MMDAAKTKRLEELHTTCKDTIGLVHYAGRYFREMFHDNLPKLRMVSVGQWGPISTDVECLAELAKRYILRLNEDPTNVSDPVVRSWIGRLRGHFADAYVQCNKELPNFPPDTLRELSQTQILCQTYLDQSPTPTTN